MTPTPPEIPQEDRRGGADASRPLWIMLVEENVHMITVFERAWRKVGGNHKLDVVQSGSGYLDRLAGPRPDESGEPFSGPDLLIVDLSPPIIDGAEVLRTIRSDGRLAGIRVCLYAHAPHALKLRGLASLCDAVLDKDARYHALVDRLGEILAAAESAAPNHQSGTKLNC